MREFYDFIPDLLRPKPDEIDEFGAFFSTFLTSSFDVIDKPGTRGGPAVCYCDVCLTISNAPHLQAKKLYARDKRRARVLMRSI